MKTCPICNGAGIINLPMRALSSEISFKANPRNTATFKKYPCPECSPKLDEASVVIWNARVSFKANMLGHPDLGKIVRRDLAYKFADFFLDEDVVQITPKKLNRASGEFEVFGKCGVVSLSVVKTIEDRAKIYQEAIAEKLAEVSIEKINSLYAERNSGISKTEATTCIKETLSELLRELGITK